MLKKVLHFIASVFMYSLLTLMFVILITVIVYVIEEKRNIDEERYTSPLVSAYIIISQSMEPTIKVYDAVVDRKILPASIKVGDVITFVSHDPISYGKTITHRVIGIDQDSEGYYRYRTKGDNNNTEDNWIVPETNVIGKVMFNIPGLGYIQHFLSTSYGWIIAIVLPCLAIIVYDIVKLIGTLLRSKKDPKKLEKQDSKGGEINGGKE